MKRKLLPRRSVYMYVLCQASNRASRLSHLSGCSHRLKPNFKFTHTVTRVYLFLTPRNGCRTPMWSVCQSLAMLGAPKLPHWPVLSVPLGWSAELRSPKWEYGGQWLLPCPYHFCSAALCWFNLVFLSPCAWLGMHKSQRSLFRLSAFGSLVALGAVRQVICSEKQSLEDVVVDRTTFETGR